MIASTTSTLLAAGILAFLLVASGVLVWDGLAATAGGRGAISRADFRRARLRLAFGAIAFAVTLWIALGLLSRVR